MSKYILCLLLFASLADAQILGRRISVAAAAPTEYDTIKVIAVKSDSIWANTPASPGKTITHGFTLANGDVIVASCVQGDDTGGPFTSASGGTWLAAGTGSSTTGNDMESGVIYRHVSNAAGEPSTYTFTVTSSTSARAVAITLVQLRGVDTTNILDTAAVSSTGTNDFTPTGPAITTVTDNAMVMHFHMASLADGSGSGKSGGAISGYALASDRANGLMWCADRATAGFDVTVVVCYNLFVEAFGTKTGGAWTNTPNDAVSERHIYTIALRPATL